MKVISRVVAYKMQCQFCGAFIEFDKKDTYFDIDIQRSFIKCPECNHDNYVSYDGELHHLNLEPYVTEIFYNEVIAWAELPKTYNPEENNNESR